MSGKGQLTITAEKARELCYESKLADHIPHIEQRIIAAAERGGNACRFGAMDRNMQAFAKTLGGQWFCGCGERRALLRQRQKSNTA